MSSGRFLFWNVKMVYTHHNSSPHKALSIPSLNV